MDRPEQTDIVATARPTPMRRALGLGALVCLGFVVIYFAMSRPQSGAGAALLIFLGVLALWSADVLRKSTAGAVELTETELRDSDGTRIALIEDIEHVERGVFAFKPSNGFLVRTRTSHARGWRLGLWWRFGRRVGIGGMMPVQQTKVMAEQLAQRIEKRDPPD